jgi:hypothetical protein
MQLLIPQKINILLLLLAMVEMEVIGLFHAPAVLPRLRIPGNYFIVIRVSPRTGLEAVEKKIS